MRLFLIVLLFFSLFFASNLTDALQQLCDLLYNLIGSLAMVMVLLSSASYAVAQMFGAELRARMVVWSQSLLQGAFVGVLMIILVPWILGIMLGANFDPTSCTFI